MALGLPAPVEASINNPLLVMLRKHDGKIDGHIVRARELGYLWQDDVFLPKRKKKTRSAGVTWRELMEKSEANIKYYQNITLKVPLKLTKFSYFKSISQSEKAH